MSSRQQYQQAIIALQAQRDLLGDAVVNTTVAVLQEMMEGLNGRIPGVSARVAQRKQVTILFANVAGFTGIVESLPDTNMLDIMNVLWRRLDNAITGHGGSIDKHVGDAVMGLFGVPVAHEDDPEQAVRAALAMRAVLSDFASDLKTTEWVDSLEEQSDGTHPLRNLQIRIGINTGPVMLGDVGSSDEYTVIGDAVNIASRLERAAPDGGILISHETYMQVSDVFNVEPLGSVPIRGRVEPVQIYLVLGARPRLFYESGRGVEGVETRMIGREAEFQRLQEAYFQARNGGPGEMITIVGEAGVGKSRLLHEFNNWLRILSDNVPVFRGRMYQQVRHLPYALMRDMLAAYFSIQDSDPPRVAEEKLVQGLADILGQGPEARQQAQAIAQLVGMALPMGKQLMLETADTPSSSERVFESVGRFVEAVARRQPAIVMLLEDLHWADEGSLQLVAYLQELCQKFPLVLVALTRPLPGATDTGRLPIRNAGDVLPLAALTEEQSRELVLEILRKLPEIPDDLANLIVERAEGNPFYVEELVKVLIEDGIIIAGEEEWRLRRSQLAEVRVPPNITGVLQARLDRLSSLELGTLQKAAVVGRVFWDSAVLSMANTAVEPFAEAQTQAALQALEKRELIFRRSSSGFAGTQEYVFKHAILHQVTYESVLLRLRPFYHRQVADWLAEQSGERIGEYAAVIAEHYDLAGEATSAAELYEVAANRALDALNVEGAIDYFRRALLLVADKPHFAAWQIRLQEEMGRLLLQQARFVEAAQVYLTMRYTAEEDGDLDAQARAGNGLAVIGREQADFTGMLANATRADQVAWLVNAESTQVHSLLLKSEAHMELGELDTAVSVAERALSLSERPDEPEAMTRSLRLLVEIHIRLGQYDQAAQYMGQLESHLALLEILEDETAVALARLFLGQLCSRLGRYGEAGEYLNQALASYQDLDDPAAAAQTLAALGETARLRGDLYTAVPFYRKAITIADSLGDVQNGLKFQLSQSEVFVDLGHNEIAQYLLQEVQDVIENVSRMSGWYEAPRLYACLAGALLAQDMLVEALRYARRAHKLAAKQDNQEYLGLAWRVIGQVLQKLPTEEKSLPVGETIYSAADCFARSLQLFETVNGGGAASRWQQMRTLRAWAAFERENGRKQSAEELEGRVAVLAEELGVALKRRRHPG